MRNFLDELFDFLSRRLFGPGRLDLLREDLVRTSAGDWHDHEAEVARRRRELAELDARSTAKPCGWKNTTILPIPSSRSRSDGSSN